MMDDDIWDCSFSFHWWLDLRAVSFLLGMLKYSDDVTTLKFLMPPMDSRFRHRSILGDGGRLIMHMVEEGRDALLHDIYVE
jgi:hypothetical protein